MGYNKQGPIRQSTINRHFKRIPANKDSKVDKAQCNHCKIIKSWNTTQFQARHLPRCPQYLSWKASQPRTNTEVTEYFRSSDSTSETLFAEAIFTSTIHFSFHDTPEWKAFFNKIGFKPPTHQKLDRELLESSYQRIKLQVQEVADAASRIQFVSDGSANITNTRVENVSFMIGAQSYYWKSSAIHKGSQNAEFTINHVTAAAREVTKRNLSKWHAFSSNTCSTQRKCWNLMKNDFELKHIHSIPCDSHRLQLIIKDLLFPSRDTEMSIFFKDTNSIITHFMKSPKELSLLRSIMRSTLGKVYALIKTVPTRWGTQIHMLNSILRIESALKGYNRHIDSKHSLQPLLGDGIFWQKLKALQLILQPIHDAQKMSESNKARLSRVFPRWIEINQHFQHLRVQGTTLFSFDIKQYCNGIGRGSWNERLHSQLQPIHIAAYVLDPDHHNVELAPIFDQKLEQYIREKVQKVEFIRFLSFRRKSDEFNPTRRCWKAESIRAFWEIARHDAPLLSKLALDLLHTTANSVPSKRAFSCMNFLQNKLRNRLSISTMDMLVFIYMNIRSLRAARGDSDYLNYMFNEMEEELMLNVENDIVFREDMDVDMSEVEEELDSEDIDYADIF